MILLNNNDIVCCFVIHVVALMMRYACCVVILIASSSLRLAMVPLPGVSTRLAVIRKKHFNMASLAMVPRRIFGAILLSALYFSPLWRCKSRQKTGRPKKDHVNNFYDSQISAIFSRGRRTLVTASTDAWRPRSFSKKFDHIAGLNKGPAKVLLLVALPCLRHLNTRRSGKTQ